MRGSWGKESSHLDEQVGLVRPGLDRWRLAQGGAHIIGGSSDSGGIDGSLGSSALLARPLWDKPQRMEAHTVSLVVVDWMWC